MLKTITLGLLTSLLILFMTSRPNYSEKTTLPAEGADVCVKLIQSCPSDCEEAESCRDEVVKRWTAKCRNNPGIMPEAQESIHAECTACIKRCRWLEGTWEGKAYQSDSKTFWTMRLTAQADSYSIEYPSLSCGGRWYLVGKETNRLRFKEKIEYGLDSCVDNGNVLIERIDGYQVAFRYSYGNSDAVVASATLRKQ